jgi:hypothetical protein
MPATASPEPKRPALRPRVGLRLKILVVTALPLLALAVTMLWFVDPRPARAQRRGDHRRPASSRGRVREHAVRERERSCSVTSAVIVRDPRFFSVLEIPHRPNDRQFLATVAGVAQDFQRIAHPDVFEVVDQRGHVAASVGRVALGKVREALVKSALAGRSEQHAIVQSGAHILLSGTPVVADGRVVGALLLGREVSGAMAARPARAHQRRGHVPSRISASRARRSMSARSWMSRGSWPRVHRSGLHDPVRISGWIAYSRPLPMALEGLGPVLSAPAFAQRRDRVPALGAHAAARAGPAAAGGGRAGDVVHRGAHHATHPADGRGLLRPWRRANGTSPLDRDRADEMGFLASRFDDMRRRQRNYVRSLQEVAQAKSEFIAVASHELRTPISIIRGWEDLLRSGLVRQGTASSPTAWTPSIAACQSLEKIAVSATRMAQSDDGNGLHSPNTVRGRAAAHRCVARGRQRRARPSR